MGLNNWLSRLPPCLPPLCSPLSSTLVLDQHAQDSHEASSAFALLTWMVPWLLRDALTFFSSTGSCTMRLTMSTKGFRTFSRVLELASQNCAPLAWARASPSSYDTALFVAAMSSFVPTCFRGQLDATKFKRIR